MEPASRGRETGRGRMESAPPRPGPGLGSKSVIGPHSALRLAQVCRRRGAVGAVGARTKQPLRDVLPPGRDAPPAPRRGESALANVAAIPVRPGVGHKAR